MVGDSHMVRLQQGEDTLPVQQQVEYECARGAGIGLLQKLVDDLEWEERPAPHVILIFLAGNDLDARDISPADVAEKYEIEARRLARLSIKVIFMSQWPRPGARVGGVNFWTNVLYYQHLLVSSLPSEVGFWYWHRYL